MLFPQSIGTLFLDIETSDYEGTEITLVCVKDASGDTIESYYGAGLGADFRESKVFDPRYVIVGHNLFCFDWPILCRHYPELSRDRENLYDTLVISRLLYYRRPGGHSLDNIGKELGIHKGSMPEEWWRYSAELDEYCQQDVRVLEAEYNRQQRYVQKDNWERPADTELRWARFVRSICETGFYFNVDEAKKLSLELTEIRDRLLSRIGQGFPSQISVRKCGAPKRTKNGCMYKRELSFLPGEDGERLADVQDRIDWIEVYDIEAFNPGSTKQVIDVLNECGWEPTEKTKGHVEFLRGRGKKDPERKERFERYGWKISETNLATLPETAPAAAHDLVVYRVVDRRLNMIDGQWLPAVKPDHRVHGTITPIATWTHRVAHSDPNIGNIVRPFGNQESYTPVEQFKHDYDGRLRGLWCAQPGSSLVGIDIKSAHLRILAHLIDDEEYTKELLSGDPHTLTMNKLGSHICKSRNKAKIFIYTWLNGGKAAKQAQLFGCSVDEAQAAIDSFVTSMPGLDKLISHDIPRDAARRYFEGIDGRLVEYDAEHGMIAGYLQNAERVLMATAALSTKPLIDELGARAVNVVHDECQVEFEGDESVGTLIGETFVLNLRRAGEFYGMRCPIDGDFKIGKNWKESH